MLNPFPELLVYSFFAPTIIRVAAALAFFYLATLHYKRREEIGRTHFVVVGAHGWVVWVMIVFEAAVGLALLLGYYVQIAALLGALAALKSLIWKRRYPQAFPLSNVASFLLLVICLSLLLSGAGALAYDLPL